MQLNRTIDTVQCSDNNDNRHRFWQATQDCVAPYVDHILHRDRFWAISIVSGSVRLWNLRSCCMMQLCDVGRPYGLLQSSGGKFNRVLLASALSLSGYLNSTTAIHSSLAYLRRLSSQINAR